MDLNKIKKILEFPLINESEKKRLIINELAKDESVVNTILIILNAERERKNKLVSKMNLLLSKAHVGLKTPKLNKDGFMQKEISEFYDKAEVDHCFVKK